MQIPTGVPDLKDENSCPRDARPHAEDADSCPEDAGSCPRDANSCPRDAHPHSHGLARGGITTMVVGICCGTGERLPKPIPAGMSRLLQPPEAKKCRCLQATNSQVIPSPWLCCFPRVFYSTMAQVELKMESFSFTLCSSTHNSIKARSRFLEAEFPSQV